MSTLASEIRLARAVNVKMTDDELTVDLTDGRVLSVPLVWFPRLLHGNAKERKRWRLIADGEGIHWPDLDEDISVEGLLAGRSSGESQQSFQKWLELRGNKGTQSRNETRRRG